MTVFSSRLAATTRSLITAATNLHLKSLSRIVRKAADAHERAIVASDTADIVLDQAKNFFDIAVADEAKAQNNYEATLFAAQAEADTLRTGYKV